MFNYSAPENLAVCGQLGGCGRPKILYNELTKKYVLYMFSGESITSCELSMDASGAELTFFTFRHAWSRRLHLG